MADKVFHSQYTIAQIEGSIGKSPRINPDTKTWEVWDIVSGSYVDTGVDADAQDAADRAEAAATAAAESERDAEGAATRAETAAATLTVDDELSDSSTNPVQNKVITEALNDKLNIDGYSALATVGNAEQLVSTVRVTDDAPYLFRTAGGAADIGNREYDKIVGGTIAWNQLIYSSNSYVNDVLGVTVTYSNGKYTLSGTPTASGGRATKQAREFILYAGHVYFYAFSGNSAVNWYLTATSSGSAVVSLNKLNSIFKATATNEVKLGFNVPLGDVVNESYYIILADLTHDFGSTIADHIYTLENAEAGNGIAWLKRYGFFTKPYYPYNAGALASVEATAHEIVGFNQWDEEWELGEISSSTGQNQPNSNVIRSKNYIPIIPGIAYYVKAPVAGQSYLQCRLYDADYNFLGAKSVTVNAEYTFDAGVAYMRFQETSTYGTSYKNDICISLTWSGYRNGEYEPYVKHSYPLDSSLTLRGVPMLDADGGLYYDGDTYAADGTVERTYGEVDLSTLTWTYLADAGNGQAYFLSDVRGVMAPPASNDDVAAILPSSGLTPIAGATMYDSYPDRTIAMQSMDGTSAEGHLWIRWSSLSDPADLVTALTGVMLLYPLAEPTTEEAEPYQSPQLVDDFGTERYVVTAQNGFEMPVGHVTEYPANLRDKLQHLPDLAEGDGSYAIQQTGAQMTLTPLLLPTGLPAAPSEDGNYKLRCTVADGEVSYSWEAEI